MTLKHFELASFISFVLILVLNSSAYSSGFSETHDRYLSGHDLARVLNQKFPSDKKPQCAVLDNSNRHFLGDISPLTGEPQAKSISPAFVKWFVDCLSQYIQASNVADRYPVQTQSSSTWLGLTELERTTNVDHWIDELIGPQVISNQAELNSQIKEALLKSVSKQTTIAEANKKIILMIALREEFLSY